MKPMRIFATSTERLLLARSLVCLLLCSTLLIGVFASRPALLTSQQTPSESLNVPELDAGFHFLYELKLTEAHAQFEAWQKSHPEDPLGSASEAAAYLFEECYRQGVLTSEFFLDDNRFLGKIPLKPDPQLRAGFFTADRQAQDLAQLRLKTNPDDPNALFAMTLSLGMQANYASLIDKQQLDSLKKVRAADVYAKKFFLGFAGIHGDKKAGIQQLEIAAEHGHYLRPFAKILLALAALREKQVEVARVQLKELVEEFPENPLFASELAKLKVPPAATSAPQ